VRERLARLRAARRPPARLRLPRHTIRLRLTAIYAVLFLLSGASLLAITYVLVQNHEKPSVLAVKDGTAGGSRAAEGIITNPAAPGAAGPTFCSAASASSVPDPAKLGQCAGFFRSQAVQLQAQVVSQRSSFLNTLLIGSGVALAVMTLAALGLGWLVSGRVLSPLRLITRTARNISASNLHERLGLSGPDDELKELGDTVDGLLARLEGSFAAQRQFVANASHELRTPLARQRTLMEVALGDPDRSVATLEAACRRVLAAGQQQERLIEGLLTLARSQRELDQFEPVDLGAVVTEMALARSADARERDVRVRVDASPAVFAGDARLAERLVSNLLDNAIRHNHCGGQVTIRTTAAPDQAVLSVVNTGPVIQPSEVPRLFEPFRHRNATRTTGDSPGLGLSIVSAIAMAHGAAVWAWAPKDGGLEIQVRFPSGPEAPARPLAYSLPGLALSER
jgi:signal transduction histidine kinase